MSKNQNQTLSLNKVESVKNIDLSIAIVTPNELNDVAGGQGITEYYWGERTRPYQWFGEWYMTWPPPSMMSPTFTVVNYY